MTSFAALRETVLEDRDRKRFYDQHSTEIESPPGLSEGHPASQSRTDQTPTAGPATNIVEPDE